MNWKTGVPGGKTHQSDTANTEYNGPKGENVKGIAVLGLRKEDTHNRCIKGNDVLSVMNQR